MERRRGKRPGRRAEWASSVTAYRQQPAGYDAHAGGGLFAVDEPVLAEFARVLRPGGDLVISDIHHEHVAWGSVIKARGPAGEPLIVDTYRHKLGDYLGADLDAGLHVRRCEEPVAARPDGPPPAAATRIGDWPDWPWSLADYLPPAARAAGHPTLVLWHFQRPR